MLLPRARLPAVLLAGAAGDALGGPFEGKAADGSRVLPRPPWRVSDDTRLTFATCRAIARARRVDPALIAEEFLVEHREGLPGVGSSTLKALRDLAAGQHWALAGARGEFAAGNGAAMRIAPLAFFGDATTANYARTIRDVASITHRNDEAMAAALAVVLAMQLLHAGRQDVFAALVDTLPDTALSDSLVALREVRTPAEAARAVGTSGRAAESVAFALFLGCSGAAIESVVIEALRAGGDTDTIAAIAAQLRAAAGEDVPAEWSAHLPTVEHFTKTLGVD